MPDTGHEYLMRVSKTLVEPITVTPETELFGECS